MPRITKLELQQLLNTRNAELEAARIRISELTGDVQALRAKLERIEAQQAAVGCPIKVDAPKPAPRPRATVFEFDPNKPGDYQRARELARDCAQRTGCSAIVRRVNHD